MVRRVIVDARASMTLAVAPQQVRGDVGAILLGGAYQKTATDLKTKGTATIGGFTFSSSGGSSGFSSGVGFSGGGRSGGGSSDSW